MTMKLTSMTFAAAIAAGLAFAPVAQAKEMYTDPEKCIAEIGELDANNDGYVDNTEYSKYGRIEMNVDTDRDGRISNDEKVVACKAGAMQALAPKG